MARYLEQFSCMDLKKNEKANINKIELRYFKKLGNDLLALTFDQLKQSIEQKILFDLEVEE